MSSSNSRKRRKSKSQSKPVGKAAKDVKDGKSGDMVKTDEVSPSVSNSPSKSDQKSAASNKILDCKNELVSNAKPVYKEISDFKKIKKGFNKKLNVLHGIVLYVDQDWRVIDGGQSRVINFVVSNLTGDIMVTMFSGGKSRTLSDAELITFSKTIKAGIFFC